jgi:pimeloyl-ACP methyl ester carboxylesterase
VLGNALRVAAYPQLRPGRYRIHGTAGSIFDAAPTAAAWRTKPSWYIVAGNDRMIPPEQERSMAKQMNASTTVVASSHVVMLAHPDAVARVIEDATAGKRK